MREQICQATDRMNEVKRAYHTLAPCSLTGGNVPTYDDMKEQAIVLLQLQNEARKRMGKRPRPITSAAIANTLR